MNTANKLTVLRVILIPVFILLMLLPFRGHMVASLIVFIFASLTDTLDGIIARRCNQITNFGKFADPLADKLLVTAALLIFVQWGQIPAWAAFIVVAREFAVTALRLVAVGEGTVIAAGISGKVKTAATLVLFCLMMTPLHDRFVIPGVMTVDTLGWLLILAVTVWSGADYFIHFNGKFHMK